MGSESVDASLETTVVKIATDGSDHCLTILASIDDDKVSKEIVEGIVTFEILAKI